MSFIAKSRHYWAMIKIRQTGLLVITGVAGYLTVHGSRFNPPTLAGLIASLAAAISGSTILNMWYDRDIDARMRRTRSRPLATGAVDPVEALWAGLILSTLGVGLALAMDLLYGAIILLGFLFDVLVYTLWLKRRTPWSIVWGGISGAMPVLAGRALALGSIDWAGIMLLVGILLWIPTHNLTFSIKFAEDYQAAGIPTVASVYGVKAARLTIALSGILTALAMGAGAYGIGMDWGLMRLLGVLTIGFVVLACQQIIHPTDRLNFGLFKYASIFMLSAMLLMVL